MDGARDEFFARAAFAVYGDGAGEGGDAADHVEDVFHGAALADNVVDLAAGGLVFAKGDVLAQEAALVEHAFEDDAHLLVLEWLHDVVDGAEPGGADGGLNGGVGGDHDGGCGRTVLVEPIEDLHAGLAVGSHAQVGDDGVEVCIGEAFDGFGGAGGDGDVVSTIAQHDLEQFAHAGFVVHHENRWLNGHDAIPFLGRRAVGRPYWRRRLRGMRPGSRRRGR